MNNDKKWVVTLFFDYEPSEVFGLFDSEEQALMWAQTHSKTWGACVAHELRQPVEEMV